MRSKSTIFISILFAGILTLTWLFYTVGDDTTAGKKDVALLISQRLNDAVETQIHGALLVARSMSSDYYVRDFLSREAELSSEQAVSEMQQYLSGIQASNNYVTAFLVSDQTKCYYTNLGLNKVIDPENDHHDTWYNIFIQNNRDMALDVDVDEANDKQWTVFVNTRIEDENGRFLGVCGVGVVIADLQQLFEQYQKDYHVNVRLVNEDGLVQVDTNTINIETTYNTGSDFVKTNEYLYTDRDGSGFEVTHFIRSLRWYLVVTQTDAIHYKRTFDPTLAVVSALIFLILGLSYYFIFHTQFITGGMEQPETDPLTGFSTRKHFMSTHGEHAIFQTTRYKVVAVINIDFYDEAAAPSDSDRILSFVADRLKEIIGKMGDIYRWREDEFLLLLEWSPEFADELLRQLCREIEKDGRVTVSIGLTAVHLSETIRQNYYRAIQGCYLVKEMGGNGVKMVSGT